MHTVSAPLRFDGAKHEYLDPETGEMYPHITGMLKHGGLVDDTWFTADSCERGQAVHDLTAQYDLGALAVADCVSRYRGYLLAHVAAMNIIQPEWHMVEMPIAHEQYRYAGRLDRAGKMYGAVSVCEGKTGGENDVHGVQLALQAILVAPTYALPPEAIQRFALYLRPDGRFRLERFPAMKDFRKAYELIKECRR